MEYQSFFDENNFKMGNKQKRGIFTQGGTSDVLCCNNKFSNKKNWDLVHNTLKQLKEIWRVHYMR